MRTLSTPEDGENFLSDLDRMQLIVLAVTSRYVYGDTFAHNTVFRHAVERHIPVLPILEEGGIESALKEGWDNPNVFQICTLIEQKTSFTGRQKVGHGLRLCVNQDSERVGTKTSTSFMSWPTRASPNLPPL